MRALFEISGLNVYIQIVVTIISISVHYLSTRNRGREETVLELVTIYRLALQVGFPSQVVSLDTSSMQTKSLPESAGP